MTLSRRSSTRQQQSALNTDASAMDSSPGTAYTERNSGSAQPLDDAKTATAEEDEDMMDKVSDDEESSDDNAITRCPCGKEKLYGDDDNDEGLMVQCDQCEVWQHCKCIGLEEEKDIPDQYYCEQCRPENHKTVKTTHGRRYKRFYNSLGFAQDTTQDRQQTTKPAKKRKKPTETSGSRKSGRQFSTRRTDTLTETTPNESNGPSSSPIPSDSTDTESGWHSHGKHIMTTVATSTTGDEIAPISKRPKRSAYSPVTDSHIVSDCPSPTLTRRKKPTSTTVATTTSSSPHTPTSSPSSTHPATTTPHATGTKRSVATSPSRNAQGRFHKNSMESRASTPHLTTTTPLTTPPLTVRDEGASYWNDNGLPQREGSPPAKIKYPSSKMTMADMNKRAKQIMDHLDKIKSTLQHDNTTAKPTDLQEDDAVTTTTAGPPPTQNHRNSNDGEQQHNDQRPRSLSTCSVSSSISSASTLPLLLDDDDASFQSSLLLATSPTTPLPLDKLFDRNNGDGGDRQHQQQESSVDMMDRVYQELLKFQRKFGGVLQVQQASSVR